MKKYVSTRIALFFFAAFLFVAADLKAQTITFTAPQNGAVWNRGQTYTIRWTAEEMNQPVMRLRMALTIDGNTSYANMQDSVVIDFDSTRYTVPIEATPNLQYRIEAVSADTVEVLYGQTGPITISETIVSVAEPAADAFAAGFTAYPNPCYGSSTLRYTLKEKTRTVIELLDVNGKQISVLRNEQQLPGQHTLLFGTAQLPAGIYFVKLQTGNTVNTIRLAVQQ